MMSGWLQDVRYGVRGMRRARGVTAVVALTLALGIGANTAIFTVINGVLIRPLPYPNSDRLATVWQDLRARGGPPDEWLTPGNYVDLRGENALFDDLAVMTAWRATVTDRTGSEPVVGEQVSHEYFHVLGISPALGRGFTAADDVPNAPRVVILSDAYWKQHFGADLGAVGRTVTISSEPHEIIGVLPAGVRPIITAGAQVWRPLRLNTGQPARGAVVLRSVARLAEGVSLARAQSMASTVAARLAREHPDYNENVGFTVTSLKTRVVGPAEPGLLALAGAVIFVLLIACVNIANLLLARGARRSRELGIRTALGAARGRVVRQLLIESLLLAVAGGVGGVLLGSWALDALIALAPAGTPRVGEIHLDGAVLLFSAVLTLATGVLFGTAPALRASRRDTVESLKDGTRSDTGASGRRLHFVLIASEIALALVLLTGSGLLLKTLSRLQRADLGFNPSNVLVAFVNPPRTGYETPAQLRSYYDQVLEKTSALPGVRAAAIASVIPLFGGDSDVSFTIEGHPAPKSESDALDVWYRLVSASYFDTLGVKLTRGRVFTTGETAPSVLVNEAFVRMFLPGENPIGHRIRPDGPDVPWFTIVGTVADMKTRGPREAPRPQMFIPYWQHPEAGVYVVAKTANAPAELAAPLKAAVVSIDPAIPLQAVQTLSSIVRDSIDEPRFVASVGGAFALLALALAAIGIYGVMAYAVSQRTREIGVRMALGARRSQVFGLVVGQGVRIAAAGIAVGIGGSLVVARELSAQLYGVAPADPATLVATSVILTAVTVAASAIPARRATAVDPMEALRQL